MYKFMTIAAVVLSVPLAAPAPGQFLSQDLKLFPDDGAGDDQFGNSIAIADGVVAVGAHRDDDNGSDSGSAYLFDASTGAQLAKLLPDDGAADDQFGIFIAIGGGVVAVGARFDDDNGSDSGSVYLFNASTGAQIAKLLPDDGAADDGFGVSVAIAGGLVAVGASGDDANGLISGSAYLFNASTGAQTAKLLPDDGAAGELFGSSIAIADGIVAVGAFRDDDNGPNSGSAYLFDASTGVQIAKLLPDDGAAGELFGTSIAIAGGLVAVGASGDDTNGPSSGSAYLFNVSTGAQIAKLLPDDGAANDFFGTSIAIADGIVAVGALLHSDSVPLSGSAYLFDTSTGAQLAEILPDDGAAVDAFGQSITMSAGVVAVGAPFDDDNGSASGSAYLFITNPCSPADLAEPFGSLNFSDVAAFLIAFDAMDPAADLSPPVGAFDISDVVAFLAAFDAGCP